MRLQLRLDRLINKLCDIRNEVTRNFDVDFKVDTELGDVEESIEQLSQTVEEELKE